MRPVGSMASTDKVSEKCELRRARMFVVRFLYGFVVTGRISFSHTVWICNCVLCFCYPSIIVIDLRGEERAGRFVGCLLLCPRFVVLPLFLFVPEEGCDL